MFTRYAENAANAIRESVPSYATLFELLRDPYERDCLPDACLIVEAFAAYGNLCGLVEYAGRNKKRGDVWPILKWLADNCRAEPRPPALDNSIGLARNWLAERDPNFVP